MAENPPPQAGFAGAARAFSPSVVPRATAYRLLSDAFAQKCVVLVSAPAGSGKTFLIRSWLDAAGLATSAAWVTVERGESSAQNFWRHVVDAILSVLHDDAFIEKLTPSPDFDGPGAVSRLASELRSLEQPLVLVISDLHELKSVEGLALLSRLLELRPQLLRLVISTRHDPQLGLHRLRLSGQLTEIRAADLRFSLDEARELFAEAGVKLSDLAITTLHERTEGWAAGLRLAALTLKGHPDPEHFVQEFSGSERTVADYLLAEVLDRQPEVARRLLLRSSILERLTPALCDILVGEQGSERVLHALEEENAFISSIDASRSWFRYHHLFAELLRLELRRTEPQMVAVLHQKAAHWYAAHGDVVDAVRHAQAAEDWPYAGRLLADNGLSLWLNGQGDTMNSLLSAFPPEAQSEPELALVFASSRLGRRSLQDAAAYIALAEAHADQVPEHRIPRFELMLQVAHVSLARRRGDFNAVTEAGRILLDHSSVESLGEIQVSNDAQAVALMNLGIVNLWALRMEDGVRFLEQAIQLARAGGRPYIEIGCLGHLALAASRSSLSRARELAAQATALAEPHGWSGEPITAMALSTLGLIDASQGRFEQARQWLDKAEAALRPELEPATAGVTCLARGIVHVSQGRLDQAVADFQTAIRLNASLLSPHGLKVQTVQFLAQTLLSRGELSAARDALSDLSAEEQEWGEARVALAALRLAERDDDAAMKTVLPVLHGDAPVLRELTIIQALLVDATARDRLGDSKSVESEVERALDLAEPERLIFPFMMVPARELLERHPRHRTVHASLLSDIMDVLGGSSLPAPSAQTADMHENLSESELRVLRHLPSNLSAPEIAGALFLSTSTVKTHMQHLYSKLGVHKRTEAVELARRLGLIGPSSRQP